MFIFGFILYHLSILFGHYGYKLLCLMVHVLIKRLFMLIYIPKRFVCYCRNDTSTLTRYVKYIGQRGRKFDTNPITTVSDSIVGIVSENLLSP